MSNPIYPAARYLRYRINATGAHGLHSPFLFHLYKDVIKPAETFALKQVEIIRKELKQSKEFIEVTDFKTGTVTKRTIGNLARTSPSNRKFAAFLHLLTLDQQYASILETGTSLGLTTAYLASTPARVATIEASTFIADLARKNWQRLGLKEIELVTGNIEETFEPTIIRTQPDLIFLDADHRASTIRFYLDTIHKHLPNIKCIVIHDIFWSPDMEEAWKAIVDDSRYNLTVDMFQAGLIFPKMEMEKQHFVVRF